MAEFDTVDEALLADAISQQKNQNASNQFLLSRLLAAQRPVPIQPIQARSVGDGIAQGLVQGLNQFQQARFQRKMLEQFGGLAGGVDSRNRQAQATAQRNRVLFNTLIANGATPQEAMLGVLNQSTQNAIGADVAKQVGQRKSSKKVQQGLNLNQSKADLLVDSAVPDSAKTGITDITNLQAKVNAIGGPEALQNFDKNQLPTRSDRIMFHSLFGFDLPTVFDDLESSLNLSKLNADAFQANVTAGNAPQAQQANIAGQLLSNAGQEIGNNDAQLKLDQAVAMNNALIQGIVNNDPEAALRTRLQFLGPDELAGLTGKNKPFANMEELNKFMKFPTAQTSQLPVINDPRFTPQHLIDDIQVGKLQPVNPGFIDFGLGPDVNNRLNPRQEFQLVDPTQAQLEHAGFAQPAQPTFAPIPGAGHGPAFTDFIGR